MENEIEKISRELVGKAMEGLTDGKAYEDLTPNSKIRFHRWADELVNNSFFLVLAGDMRREYIEKMGKFAMNWETVLVLRGKILGIVELEEKLLNYKKQFELGQLPKK